MLTPFIIAYFLLTLGIGFYVSLRVKKVADYVSAGRQLPLVFNSFALFALWYGSETIFGASSEFIDHGLLGVIEDPFGGVLCLFLFSLFFARKLYRMNLITLGDLFRNTYGPKVEMITTVFMIISFFGYVAAQLVALGLLFQTLLGLDLWIGISVSALVVGAYTMAGGMWAISVTDLMQSVVIILGMGWVTYSVIDYSGNLNEMIHSLPDGFLDFTPSGGIDSWMEYAGAWSVLGLGSLASQDIFQRVNAAKSERAAVLSGYIGGTMYFVAALFPLIIGLVIKTSFPEFIGTDTQVALPQLILKIGGMPVQIMLFGALISAIFSTCSGAILAPATLLSENIIKPALKGRISDQQLLRYTRFSVVFIVVVSAIMGLTRQNIYELVGESSILGMVSILVPMIIALYGKRKNTTAAIISMVAGFTTWLIFEHGLSVPIPSGLAGLMGSILGYFIPLIFIKKQKSF